METCHFCSDTVEKLNDEYEKLSKQYEQYDAVFSVLDKITKKNNYKYCLQYIKKLRNKNLQCIDDVINDYERGDAGYATLDDINELWGDNYKALLDSAKEFDDTDKRFMDEGFYSDEDG